MRIAINGKRISTYGITFKNVQEETVKPEKKAAPTPKKPVTSDDETWFWQSEDMAKQAYLQKAYGIKSVPQPADNHTEAKPWDEMREFIKNTSNPLIEFDTETYKYNFGKFNREFLTEFLNYSTKFAASKNGTNLYKWIPMAQEFLFNCETGKLSRRGKKTKESVEDILLTPRPSSFRATRNNGRITTHGLRTDGIVWADMSEPQWEPVRPVERNPQPMRDPTDGPVNENISDELPGLEEPDQPQDLGISEAASDSFNRLHEEHQRRLAEALQQIRSVRSSITTSNNTTFNTRL